MTLNFCFKCLCIEIFCIENWYLGKKLVEVSADGVIYTNKKMEECASKVEIKCPYPPTPSMFKADVYYSLPVYYVLQLLSEMASEPISDSCIFVCYSPKSSVIMRVTFDEQLWHEIISHTDDIYSVDKAELKAPKTKSEFIKCRLPKLLKEFLANNVTTLCEVPSIKSVSTNDSSPENSIAISEPYKMPSFDDAALPFQYTIDDFQQLLDLMKESIKAAYELSRVKATEVLIWMLSSTDRTWDPEKPYAYPIAYGLKGGKFDLEVKRRYFDFVMNEVVRRGYSVLCTVFDNLGARLYYQPLF